MSNFLILKALFTDKSTTPAIGTYTAAGATALFNQNSSYGSNEWYLYNTAVQSAVKWFVPTKETTDFELVADFVTPNGYCGSSHFIIADSSGTTMLKMWTSGNNYQFGNGNSTTVGGGQEYIGKVNPGKFGVFHQFRVRVHKLTESSSSVEVYVDSVLKLSATAGASLVTCAKIGFLEQTSNYSTSIGVKNVYLYDLSDKPVVDRATLLGAFNQFGSWCKSNFTNNPTLITEYSTNQPTSTLTIGSLVPYKPVTVYMYFEATSSGIVKLDAESEALMIQSKQIEPSVAFYTSSSSTSTLWSYRGSSGNVKLYALLIPLGPSVSISLSNLSYPVQVRAYQ